MECLQNHSGHFHLMVQMVKLFVNLGPDELGRSVLLEEFWINQQICRSLRGDFHADEVQSFNPTQRGHGNVRWPPHPQQIRPLTGYSPLFSLNKTLIRPHVLVSFGGVS